MTSHIRSTFGLPPDQIDFKPKQDGVPGHHLVIEAFTVPGIIWRDVLKCSCGLVATARGVTLKANENDRARRAAWMERRTALQDEHLGHRSFVEPVEQLGHPLTDRERNLLAMLWRRLQTGVDAVPYAHPGQGAWLSKQWMFCPILSAPPRILTSSGLVKNDRRAHLLSLTGFGQVVCERMFTPSEAS